LAGRLVPVTSQYLLPNSVRPRKEIRLIKTFDYGGLLTDLDSSTVKAVDYFLERRVDPELETVSGGCSGRIGLTMLLH